MSDFVLVSPDNEEFPLPLAEGWRVKEKVRPDPQLRSPDCLKLAISGLTCEKLLKKIESGTIKFFITGKSNFAIAIYWIHILGGHVFVGSNSIQDWARVDTIPREKFIILSIVNFMEALQASPKAILWSKLRNLITESSPKDTDYLIEELLNFGGWDGKFK